MPDLPTGTVTFLFTDIEGSTRLLVQHPHAYPAALTRHDAILRKAVDAHDGTVFETVGDAIYAAFARATDALGAATAAQLDLGSEPWGDVGAIRVRMGLHTGEVEQRGEHYFGPALYRCARLMAIGHGGQVLLSGATAALVREALPDMENLRDLGSHRLKDLAQPESVFQLQGPGLPAEFPPLASLDVLPNNLPLQLTRFIGREREIAEVKRLLESERLLTLTGMGGAGKTRLALQIAADQVGEFSDGVWLVELASLSDAALVPAAVAVAVGVREQPGTRLQATLADVLPTKHLLIVLDNCEHLVQACANLAETLLRVCPKLRILATSREALGVAGECAWAVAPLSVPQRPTQRSPSIEQLTQYDAVRLFLDRATAVRPEFALTSTNAPLIARICSRLDGLPLAIELAAAWVGGLGLDQIAGYLDRHFDLLQRRDRTAPARQQSLSATLAWSYQLLSEPERRVFERLSVFPGSFSLDGAEAVCREPDTYQLVARLVERSLIVSEAVGDSGGLRYRMLETVRQFACQRLEDTGAFDEVRYTRKVLLRACGAFMARSRRARWWSMVRAAEARLPQSPRRTAAVAGVSGGSG